MSKFIKINVGTNQALTKLVFTMLTTMGYPCSGIENNVLRYQTSGTLMSIFVPTGRKYGVTYSETTWNASGEYVNASVFGVQNAPVEIKLNSEHTAIVSEDKKTVKVGCQEIPADKVDELYRALHA